MATKRRTRCFVCKNLVATNQANIDPDSTNQAYSVVNLRIEKKSGCICSDCIEYYAEKMEVDIETKAGKYDDKPSKDTPADYGFKEESPLLPPMTASATSTPTPPPAESQPPTREEIEKKEFERLIKRYECLDYSLDSLAKQVTKVVFGQNQAVKDVLYSLYFNQMSNLLEDIGQAPLKHKHILLIGGTGVGKTLLASTAAKVFGVVYSISNATPITSAGYIGDKVEHVLERLLDAANGDIEKAQNGVIILDEFDKKRTTTDSSGKDVSGKAVQQELLKILEPTRVWIKNNTQSFYTGNLTIILMGAFVGLDEIIESRTKPKNIGFGADSDNAKQKDTSITQDDLIEYGFIPEIIGRIPIICELNKLTHDVLVDIIYAQLERYNILFQIKNFEFCFDPILIEKIADELLESKTGARDVETKIDAILRPALYRVFQSPSEGICEIDSNGAIKILSHSKHKKGQIDAIEIPPIQKYVDVAAEYE